MFKWHSSQNTLSNYANDPNTNSFLSVCSRCLQGHSHITAAKITGTKRPRRCRGNDFTADTGWPRHRMVASSLRLESPTCDGSFHRSPPSSKFQLCNFSPVSCRSRLVRRPRKQAGGKLWPSQLSPYKWHTGIIAAQQVLHQPQEKQNPDCYLRLINPKKKGLDMGIWRS